VLIAVFWCQLPNSTMTAQSSMIAEKCFVVWNSSSSTDDNVSSTTLKDTVSERLACPLGWNYNRDPIETSIVTDVSITEQSSHGRRGSAGLKTPIHVHFY